MAINIGGTDIQDIQIGGPSGSYVPIVEVYKGSTLIWTPVSNIIFNGDFINGELGWDLHGVTIVGGEASYSANNDYIVQHEADMIALPLPGVEYRVTLYASQPINSLSILNEAAEEWFTGGHPGGTEIWYDFTIPADETVFGFMLRLNDFDFSSTTIDNISMVRK